MIYQCGLIMATRRGVCQNPFVPALDAGPQKSKSYQSDVYMTGSNAIPRQAREQDSFDTPPMKNSIRLARIQWVEQSPAPTGRQSLSFQ